MVFFLLLLVLTGLYVTPCPAASDILKVGDPISYHRTTKIAAISGSRENFADDPGLSTLLALSAYPTKDEDLLGEDEIREEKQETVEPVTRKVPIWGEKVREMGFDLPLPFGAGVNFTWIDQGIDLKDLKIGVGSGTSELSGISISNARSRDTATTMRLDAWLLPFASIYGLFGYIKGNADLDVNVPGLTIGPIPIIPDFILPVDVDYEGATFGGGITLAGGYKNFFGTVDANYTHSEIDVVDGEIRTLTISPRLGILFDSSYIRGSFAFWLGAMYMRYKQEISDTINLTDIDPGLPSVDVEFEVELKNDDPWNFLFGGHWEITKRWQFMAEGGVGDRKQIITGLVFRF